MTNYIRDFETGAAMEIPDLTLEDNENEFKPGIKALHDVNKEVCSFCDGWTFYENGDYCKCVSKELEEYYKFLDENMEE